MVLHSIIQCWHFCELANEKSQDFYLSDSQVKKTLRGTATYIDSLQVYEIDKLLRELNIAYQGEAMLLSMEL